MSRQKGSACPDGGGPYRRGMSRQPLTLAADLRAAGHSWVHIGAVLRQRLRVPAMVAMRLAHGWSQADAAEQWNRRWPDDLKTFKQISYWETWPAKSGYRPSLLSLKRMAELYQCAVGDLLDQADFRHLDDCHRPAACQACTGAHPGAASAMNEPVPVGGDPSTPSASRMYDYYLGGCHNLRVDREAAERVLAAAPWVRDVARHNRRFLGRAVRFLAGEAGIDQFLDLGSGIPTVGNVHEIAQRIRPGARVVYVDNDPVAVAHSRMLLSDNPTATVIEADIRRPNAVLGHAETGRMLDFSQPVAALMVSVLLFITDADKPGELVAAYTNRLTAGSYLAISHATSDGTPAGMRAQIKAVAATYAQAGQPVVDRSRAEIAAWLEGSQLVDPGLVRLPDWRPDGNGSAGEYGMLGYAAVAKLP